MQIADYKSQIHDLHTKLEVQEQNAETQCSSAAASASASDPSSTVAPAAAPVTKTLWSSGSSKPSKEQEQIQRLKVCKTSAVASVHTYDIDIEVADGCTQFDI